MSFQARETSTYSGKPYEMFLFQTESQVWRFTGADETKTLNGVTYTPEAITHTEPKQDNELTSGQIKVTVPRDNEIAALFYAYIPTSPLWLTIYRAHDGEADSETVVYWTGKVKLATFTEACELTCVPEQDALKRHLPGITHTAQCSRVLFAPLCGVDKTTYRVQGTLTSVSGITIKSATFATKADGWFTNGYIEFGNQRRMIVKHSGDTLTLLAGMPDLAAGDAVYAYAGCNRKFNGDCLSKFANTDNYFGFPWLPTTNPFNSGLV